MHAARPRTFRSARALTLASKQPARLYPVCFTCAAHHRHLAPCSLAACVAARGCRPPSPPCRPALVHGGHGDAGRQAVCHLILPGACHSDTSASSGPCSGLGLVCVHRWGGRLAIAVHVSARCSAALQLRDGGGRPALHVLGSSPSHTLAVTSHTCPPVSAHLSPPNSIWRRCARCSTRWRRMTSSALPIT